MEVLRQIEEAAAKIAARFQAIHKVSDFTNSPTGVDKMDAICMMLIVIGESLKNLAFVAASPTPMVICFFIFIG
jgi:hypothetical protein